MANDYEYISIPAMKRAMDPVLDEYAGKLSMRRRILNKHYWGKAPSVIDKEIGLVSGTARAEIVEFWKWNARRHKYSHR